VDPSGGTLYVTGQAQGEGCGWDCVDYATIAYDAASGAQLWLSYYDAGDGDAPSSVAVSPDGSQVFVTGLGGTSHSSQVYATVAYASSTGIRDWVQLYHGEVQVDDASALVVSPDGTRVYVTGSSENLDTGLDYATIAYAAADGEELWVARYDGPAHDWDRATALDVSPDGTRVFVSGSSPGVGTDDDYATLAYDAMSGIV
jgi:DNA-binding beta-propeller fold protein YncE